MFQLRVTKETLEILEIIEGLRRISSTKEKQHILKQHINNEGLKTILELTYNPFKKYKITEKTFEGKIGEQSFINLLEVADMLSNNNINDDLRGKTLRFINDVDEEIRDLYKSVLLKDLRIGVNASTINKVWKGLIPSSEGNVEIKPMLASKFDFEKPPIGEFAVTEKLDGIRCMAICKEDSIQLYTRQGKLIEGCKEIEGDLMQLQKFMDFDFVLDGELLATGCSYENVYKETTKRVKNKNKIKTGIQFIVFDIIDILEFENLRCETSYRLRMNVLEHFREETNMSHIAFLEPLYVGSDVNRIVEFLDEYRDKGAEGLMVNLLDSVYEFKRSKAILKVKVMNTMDLRVVGYEEGAGRNKNRLGALLVDYKGNTVKVGSGFSDSDRDYIWERREEYIGRVIEVSYFEITKNKDGGESLRFPIFQSLREIGKEVSYH